MFVSVVLDPGAVDSAKALAAILSQYGFVKIQKACWEHSEFYEGQLSQLKKDMDRVSDFYDNIRIYQFPVKGCLAITEMKKKKWKRCVMQPNDNQADTKKIKDK